MDEHSGPLPQQAGDVQVLQHALLQGAAGEHQSPSRDHGGGSPGGGARVQWTAHCLQRQGICGGGVGSSHCYGMFHIFMVY